MARFFRRGKSKIYFLPDIVSPSAAATAGELSAAGALDLSFQIQAIAGFQLTNAPIATPDLVDVFTKSIPGEDTTAASTLTFYDSDTSGGFTPGVTTPWEIRDALEKGNEGYIVLFPYGKSAGKRAEHWNVQTSGVNDEWTTANEAARFVVGFAILDVPFQNITY